MFINSENLYLPIMFQKLLFMASFFSLFGIGKSQDFQVGQVWYYESRAQEPNSRLQILKIDAISSTEKFIHIAVEDLKIATSDEGKFVDRIGHLPMSEAALRKSVVKMVSKKEPLPDFHEGYGMWREAFDVGKAGVFEVSVLEAVQFVEETYSQNGL
jgi:hypothetical protein